MKLFHLENSVVCGQVRQFDDLARITLTFRLNQTDPVGNQMSFHVISREFLGKFTRQISF